MQDGLWQAALAFMLVTALERPALAEDAASVIWPSGQGRAAISAMFRGDPIELGLSRRSAGAIDSLTWRGTQFLNAYDHGRELQSALSFDGYGECFNPTEAGSAADGTGSRSSSLLLDLDVRPDRLRTRTQMAYWIGPAEAGGACPKGAGPYETARSDVVMDKEVLLGAAGVPNAIAYHVTFATRRAYVAATFEVVTAYMPVEFSQFWTFDPPARQLRPLSDGPGEQSLPVIFTTPDKSRALGVYNPDLPQASVPGAGYGRWRFANFAEPGAATVKWNSVWRARDVSPGNYKFTSFVVIGSLQDVRDGMVALQQRSEQRDKPPAEAPKAHST